LNRKVQCPLCNSRQATRYIQSHLRKGEPMDAAPQAGQVPIVYNLLQAGGSYGLLLLALGLLLTVWGLFNFFLVRNRLLLIVQVFYAFVPAILGVAGLWSSYQQWVEMTLSPQAPRPHELAQVVSFAMACGLFGPLATVIPAFIGVLALARATPPHRVERESHDPARDG
jgi:hypothetical protein